MTQDKIEYHLSEVLSTNDIESLHLKYINNKCRQLHSAGFSDVSKFYKKIFALDFKNFHTSYNGITVSLKTIQKYHSIRHLLVHKLGKVDDQFRKDYNNNDNVISITHDDIVAFFNNIISFSAFINNHLDAQKIVDISDIDEIYSIKFDPLDSTPYMIEPYYSIKLKKERHELSEILSGTEVDPDTSNIITIKLQGNYSLIRRYYKDLKKLESKGNIKIIENNTTRNNLVFQKKLKSYPFNEVQAVMNELPEKPWEKHIHKKIAQKLGWSNSKVGNIIAVLLTEQDTKVSIEEKEIEMSIGEERDLNISITPIQAQHCSFLNWRSSNQLVAKVEGGHITALSLGTTTISASVNMENKSAICKVCVTN